VNLRPDLFRARPVCLFCKVSHTLQGGWKASIERGQFAYYDPARLRCSQCSSECSFGGFALHSWARRLLAAYSSPCLWPCSAWHGFSKFLDRKCVCTLGKPRASALCAAQAAILDVPFVDVFNDMSDPSLPLTTVEYQEWCAPASVCRRPAFQAGRRRCRRARALGRRNACLPCRRPAGPACRASARLHHCCAV
jgi:hypothetical protein